MFFACDETFETEPILKNFSKLVSEKNDTAAVNFFTKDIVEELKNRPEGFEIASQNFVEEFTLNRATFEIIDEDIYGGQAKATCSIKTSDKKNLKKIILLQQDEDTGEWKITTKK